jgi:hypothetical protein
MVKFKIAIFFIILTVIYSLIIHSCTKDEETQPSVPSTSITGNWICSDNASENGIYAAQSYTIEISSSDSSYTISNFGNLGINVDAICTINGTTINLNNQIIGDINVNGYGDFYNNNKNVSFTYFLDGEKIESTWTKD